MSLIKDWLPDFLTRHCSRLRPGDWPEIGTEDEREFTRIWFAAFLAERVTEREADTASVRLGTRPPAFAREHLPAVMCEVFALREANAKTECNEVPATREAAERASRDCGHCSGSGQVRVYHPSRTGDGPIVVRDFRGREWRRPSAVVAHCSCPMGRWLRACIRASAPDLLQRIPDFIEVVGGRSRWLAEDPSIDAESEPSAPAHAGLRRMLDRVAEPIGEGAAF